MYLCRPEVAVDVHLGMRPYAFGHLLGKRYAAANTHHVDVRAGALQEIVAHYAAHGIGLKTHTVGHLANQFIYRLLEKNVHC